MNRVNLTFHFLLFFLCFTLNLVMSHLCCRMSRFEKTNEMLLNFNRLSDARYESTQADFRKHIHLLHDMRKDLDNIFRRIRLVVCCCCGVFCILSLWGLIEMSTLALTSSQTSKPQNFVLHNFVRYWLILKFFQWHIQQYICSIKVPHCIARLPSNSKADNSQGGIASSDTLEVQWDYK